jgi:hypothetical protein
LFILGTIFGAIKIFFSSGLPLEQFAAGGFISSLIITEIINQLTTITSDELNNGSQVTTSGSTGKFRKLMRVSEVACGAIAILL